MVTIKIQDKGVAPLFARLAAMGRSPSDLTIPAARDVANLLKRHYRENEAAPFKHPGAKRHFWRDVLKTVQAPVSVNGGKTAVVSITHPAIRQKVLGGTITAKRARALTIPISAAAYESGTARSFEHETGQSLFPVGATADGTRGALASRNPDGTLSFHFLLRRSVRQQPEPRALPSLAEMTRVAVERMRAVFARIIARTA